MRALAGKVAAVTGAGSGIGRQLAVQLARRGCHLSISDVSEAGLAETVNAIGEVPVRVVTDIVDVASRDQVHAWADKVVADHGSVNFIFNNAGVALGSTVESMGYEDLEWLLGINLWGVIHGTKAFLPHIKSSGDGHIINISSVFGLCAQPTQSAYNMSKYAVRGFTESLRQELDIEGGAVSATCVHPGGIKTNIAQSGRTNESVKLITNRTPEHEVKVTEKMLKTSPEAAAEKIIAAVQRNKRRVLVGTDAFFIDKLVRFFPVLYQRMLVAALRRSRK